MKHYTIPSLAIIAVIVTSLSAIIAVGYLAPDFFQGVSELNPKMQITAPPTVQEVKKIPSLPNTLSANITVISEWSVYENQTIGLFFKYPSTWTYPDLEKSPLHDESYTPDGAKPAWTLHLGKTENKKNAPYTLSAFPPAHTPRIKNQIESHDDIGIIGNFEVNTYQTIMYAERGLCGDKKAIVFAPYAIYMLTSNCNDTGFTPNGVFESLLSTIVIENDVKTLPTTWPELSISEVQPGETHYVLEDIIMTPPEGWKVHHIEDALTLSPFNETPSCETSYCSYLSIKTNNEHPSIRDSIDAFVGKNTNTNMSFSLLRGHEIISYIQKNETCDHLNARLFVDERIYDISYGCYTPDSQQLVNELLDSISIKESSEEFLTEE